MHNPLTVTQLTLAIKKNLEQGFGSVSVRGEISNLKEQSSGHFYFTLKDGESQISAVLFKGHARSLSRLPKEGNQVVLHGNLTVYTPRGNYQIIVHQLEYLGVGELLIKLHELKNKLDKLGWLDPNRKKKLPKFPKTIGVVTSATGAVIQDILNVLSRRFSGAHVILNPVRVQGDGAAKEIAEAIAQFNKFQLADVLIVGRGGGSFEDLWAFNEEIVAQAIYQSQIPIISAVGHETDFSIADFVADVRAPTPSAAAEIVIAEKAHQLQFLAQSHSRLSQTIKGQLRQKRLQLHALERQASSLKPTVQILSSRQKLFQYAKSIRTSIGQQLQRRRQSLAPDLLEKRLAGPLRQMLVEKKRRLSQLAGHLKGIDPNNLLTKGYCILFHEKKDSVILNIREVTLNEKVRIRLSDGTLRATLDEIKTCP
ncbi:MAG TPA: exodeoxyribonuclease VII large subunit [Rhabdochlamydiaceae bacterium]|nr:exodeoxyribonuclease VII large subunit [Rhabdochlamydiaceae bacterium]